VKARRRQIKSIADEDIRLVSGWPLR